MSFFRAVAALFLATLLPAEEDRGRPEKGEVTGFWAPGQFSLLEGSVGVKPHSHLQIIHAGLVTRLGEEAKGGGHGSASLRQGFFGLGPSLKTSVHGWHLSANPWAGVSANRGGLGPALGFHTVADHHRVEAESRLVLADAHREHGWQKLTLADPAGEVCVKVGRACLGAGVGRSGGWHPEATIKIKVPGSFRLSVGAFRTHEGWRPFLGLERKF